MVMVVVIEMDIYGDGYRYGDGDGYGNMVFMVMVVVMVTCYRTIDAAAPTSCYIPASLSNPTLLQVQGAQTADSCMQT